MCILAIHLQDTAFWSAKAEDRNATYQYAGLMSKEDKYKLDNIETGATNFSMPSKLDPTIIETDNDHLFVTLEEKTNWSNKASNNLVTPNVNGIMSKEDKIKLNSVDMNANYYIHPQTHDPSIILEDASHRFVTDEQILAWNNKLDGSLATATSNGGMSKEDKAKLDSIEEGANKSSQHNYHQLSLLKTLIIDSLLIKKGNLLLIRKILNQFY